MGNSKQLGHGLTDCDLPFPFGTDSDFTFSRVVYVKLS